MENNLIISQKQKSLIPTKDEFDLIKEMAMIALASSLLGEAFRGNDQQAKAKAIMIAMKGYEIGMPPMQALSQLFVVNGKVGMMAEGMMAQVFRFIPNAVVNFIEMSDEKCVIKAKRPGNEMEFATFSFTMDDAKRANLLNKGPWRQYPRAMLRSRAVSEMCRAMFPDALCGVSYTPEELGANVDEDGRVIRDVQETNRPQKPVDPKPKPSENKSPKPSPSGEANDVAPHGFTEKPHLVDSHEPDHSMPDGDSLLLNDPGTYEIEVGQNAQRKRICDIPIDALEAWVHYWDDALTKTGGKAHVEKRLGKGFKVNAVAYLEFAKEIQEFDKQLEMGE